MFTIHSKPLRELTSPVASLIPLIPNAMGNISPERDAEFASEYPEFDIFVEDTTVWRCGVDTTNRRIHLSIFAIEVLWATAYAHTLLYQRAVGGRIPNNTDIAQTLSQPECKVALDLLAWITKRRLGHPVQANWPKNAPSPRDKNDPEDQKKLATEVALGALAFIIHHELAHIRLLHSGKSEVEPERDADHAAVDWILRDGDISANSLADKKRLLCIAHALSVTVARDIYTGDFDGVTHPRSFDRLNYALTRHLNEENHLSRSFIAFVLKLHMDNSSVPYWKDSKEFTTFDEILQSFFDAFANFCERPPNSLG